MGRSNLSLIGKRAFWLIISLYIALFVGLRLTHLESIPAGFYIDEAGEAGNMLCIATTGKAYDGSQRPLYATGPAGGKLSPVFVYLNGLWTQLTDTSIGSIRLFVALWNILGLIGLFFLGRFWGGKSAGYLAVLVGVMCPWAIISSRVAWDPSIVATPTIWGTWALCRARNTWHMAIAGVILAFATYCYQAMRVEVIFLSAAILCYLKCQHRLTWRGLASFVGCAAVVAIPQILFVFSPEGRSRFNGVSIFARHYIDQNAHGSYFQLLGIFISNFFQHLTPRYLFISGDANLRHSLAGFGQLGFLELLALTVALPAVVWHGILKRSTKLRDSKTLAAVLICMAGITASIIPSAMTWDGIPHALRSGGSWPFFTFMTAVLLAAALKIWPRMTMLSVVLIGGLFTSQLVPAFYKSIKSRSYSYFDGEIVDAARQAKSDADWQAIFQKYGAYSQDAWAYHLMHYRGMSCEQSRQFIKTAFGR